MYGEHIDFYKADLRKADFEGSELYKVDFTETYLDGANFTDAKIRFAIFYAVDLTKVNLEKAEIKDTIFVNCKGFKQKNNSR